MSAEKEAVFPKCLHARTEANTYRTTRASGRLDDRCRLCQTAKRNPAWLRIAKLRAGAR